MRTRTVILALGAALMLGALSTLGTISAYGAVPDSINLQGVLKSSSGNPVPNASYSVTFQICSTAVGGSALWTEVQSLTTNGGQFTCMLGSITPIPDTVLNRSGCFLSMQVNPDPEMTPRIPLASVPYSLRVGSVEGAMGGGLQSDLYLYPPPSEGVSEATPMCPAPSDCIPRSQCALPKIWRVGDLSWNPTSNTCGRLCVTDGHEPTIQLDGGSGNVKICGKATIGPGLVNDGDFGFVAGCNNTITAVADNATVSGGQSNTSKGVASTIGGGYVNTINESGDYATVGGGTYNVAEGYGSTVGGGEGDIANGHYSSILGGYGNVTGTARPPDNDDGRLTTIGGGYLNVVHGRIATIGGGERNSADGALATVPGGYRNSAAGIGSFAAGRQAITTSSATGSFVWADYTAADFTSNSPGQFLIRAAGNVGINTESPTSMLNVNGPIATALSVVAGSVSLLDAASVTLVDNVGAAPVVVNLPQASTCKGRQITFKKISAAAGVVTVTPLGGDGIDGPPGTSYPLAAQYSFVVLVSDGVNHWYIVGKG